MKEEKSEIKRNIQSESPNLQSFSTLGWRSFTKENNSHQSDENVEYNDSGVIRKKNFGSSQNANLSDLHSDKKTLIDERFVKLKPQKTKVQNQTDSSRNKLVNQGITDIKKTEINKEWEKLEKSNDIISDIETYKKEKADRVKLGSFIQDAPQYGSVNTKRKRVWLIPLIIVVVLAIVYFSLALYYRSHFLPKTYVGEIDLSGADAESAERLLKPLENNYQLTITNRNGDEDIVTAMDVDLKLVNRTLIKKAINQQNIWKWPVVRFGEPCKNAYELFGYNPEKLSEKKAFLKALTTSGTVVSENAQPIYENDQIIIKEEVLGDFIDSAVFDQVLHTALVTGNNHFNMVDTGCYVAPSYKKNSPEVVNAKTAMEKWLDTEVTYAFDNSTEVISRQRIGSWLTVDESMNATFNFSLIWEYINQLAVQYKKTEGTSAQLINVADEIAELTPILQSGEKVTRQPVFTVVTLPDNLQESDNGTFVEVNKTNQTIHLVINWGIALTSPVVTGCVADGNDTPTGSFRVTYKETNKTMIGPDWEEFSCYWMPFNGDYGLHDADGWRMEYGGEIYKTDGSHGCVNMPLESAATIFSVVEAGTPVIVHE